MVTNGSATIVAGDTQVTVAHTYGDVPPVVSLEPQDDLGGRGAWVSVSSKTASSFVIQISSPDMADHIFGWAIVAGATGSPPSGGAYCSPDLVDSLSQVSFAQLGFVDKASLDAFLTDTIIPAAQKLVEGYVQHNFQNNAGTIKLDGRGKRIPMIPPPYLPVMSVSSVQIDGIEVVGSIKIFETYLASDGRYFTENQARHQNVQITLTYGYTAVPDDVAYVTAQICANMLADMVRRKMMPDTVAKAMQVNAETVIISGMGKRSDIFTAELKEALTPYMYTRMDVTG
jgi:hypothetical protein